MLRSQVLFLEGPATDLLQALQNRLETFKWLQMSVVPVFTSTQDIPSGIWPAPAYPPWFSPSPLPEGLERGRVYLVSRTRSVFSLYPEIDKLDLDVVERDLMVWEARHC